LGISGLVMLYGTWGAWVFDLHRIGGWALLTLFPWKGVIVANSLRRGLQGRWSRALTVSVSLLLAGLVILVVVLALMWMWRLGRYKGFVDQTIIAWHWILGLLVFPILALHVWWRWPRPRRIDFTTRRGLLRTGALAVVGLVGWQLGLVLARARITPERPRRAVTGSRGFGLFAGNDFPLTGESTIQIDPAQWRLAVEGAVARSLNLRYEELLAMADALSTQTLDCTSGWYTVQDWQGVPLVRLLEQAEPTREVAGVRLESVTGYNHSYPWQEAQNTLLATHVSGEVLAPRHGYPVRAVVPDRRGWFWVKWLNRIVVLDSELEMVGGVLYAPRQVLRQW
jgi:DMSO/TMAO reductase YedYZ molybdopterin-dependent catalytic subunit